MMIVKPHWMLPESKGMAMLYEQLRYTCVIGYYFSQIILVQFDCYVCIDHDSLPLFAMLLRAMCVYSLVGCVNSMDLAFWNFLHLNCFQEKCGYNTNISVGICSLWLVPSIDCLVLVSLDSVAWVSTSTSTCDILFNLIKG